MSLNTNNKISIFIDWDSKDCGYSALTSNKFKNFLFTNLANNNNLINTQDDTGFYVFGRRLLKLQAVPVKKWKKIIEWDNLDCKHVTDWIQTTKCKRGSKRPKVFVKIEGNKNAAGFASYLLCLFNGSITLEKHKQFVKILKKTMGKNKVIIHNLDLHWFHLKTKI